MDVKAVTQSCVFYFPFVQPLPHFPGLPALSGAGCLCEAVGPPCPSFLPAHLCTRRFWSPFPPVHQLMGVCCLKRACRGWGFPDCTSSGPFSRLVPVPARAALNKIWQCEHVLKHFSQSLTSSVYKTQVTLVSVPFRGWMLILPVVCWLVKWILPSIADGTGVEQGDVHVPQSSQAVGFSASPAGRGPSSALGRSGLQLRLCSPSFFT